jgi:2-polyprenyl-3-methyl-5-hydroxy-6-metoxy-1,4-benzoquinol methylase
MPRGLDILYGDRSVLGVAQSWNANADQWTSDVRRGYDSYRDLFSYPAFEAFLPPVGGLNVIDFGCGEGTNTRRLARLGAKMTGVDISEKMIRHAKMEEERNAIGVTYFQSSFADCGVLADDDLRP